MLLSFKVIIYSDISSENEKADLQVDDNHLQCTSVYFPVDLAVAFMT